MIKEFAGREAACFRPHAASDGVMSLVKASGCKPHATSRADQDKKLFSSHRLTIYR
jgi:hypothetical protein